MGIGQFSFQSQRRAMPKKVQSVIPQLCLTLCDSMNYSLLGSSVGGIFQARILEWAAIPISREKCSTYRTTVLISHASKVMLKILQARLQQYVKGELPNVQARFRKGRGTRSQVDNIHWNHRQSKGFQKNIYFCFTDYAKVFDYVDRNKLWKVLEEMGIPDHLTSLLRNLCIGQKATVRTGHRTMVWFKIEKGVHQGCLLSPCRVYITGNAGLD